MTAMTLCQYGISSGCKLLTGFEKQIPENIGSPILQYYQLAITESNKTSPPECCHYTAVIAQFTRARSTVATTEYNQYCYHHHPLDTYDTYRVRSLRWD